MFRRYKGNRNCKRNTIVFAGISIGMGIGIFLILYLPLIVWLYIVAIVLIIAGVKTLFEK